MRAAVVSVLGEPPAYSAHPDPVPEPGKSLVRVTAAPVVPLDLLCASGVSYFGPPAVPYVPGVQGTGLVERSETLEVGSRVWFATSAGMAPGDGGLAEYVVVPDADLVPITVAVGDADMAALGLSAVAAWMALTWKARFRAGERVLVLGGGGAVGQVAVGAARILGADRVVAVCRSGEAAQRALAAGAMDVVTAVLDPASVVGQLRKICGEVDVVIDPVFGATAAAASQVLAVGGRLVNLGSAGGEEATFSSATLRSRSLEIVGYTNNALTVEQRRAAVAAVSQHAADGRLAVAHEVHALADIEAVWSRQVVGLAAARSVLLP